jgi:hypothetical protein
VVPIKVAYKTLYDYFSFSVWKVLKDYAFSKLIYDNYVIRKPIIRRELSNKVY